MRTFKYYIWYFYFCIYLSAAKWGARNPESNATNLIGIILVICESILLQISAHFGYELSRWPTFALIAIPSFLIPPRVFNSKKVKSKRTEFDFLRNDYYYKRRIIVVSSVVGFFILLNALVAILRNIYEG
jgi:hypothetical protein